MSDKRNNRGQRSGHRPKARHINPWTGNAFSRLPDELVLAVLARIAKPVDVVRFGATSRRLHEISLDDSLWRSFFQKRGHTLVHTRFAEFGKTWLWLLRVYSSDQSQAVSAWPYVGDTDEIGQAHGYGVIHRVRPERYEGEWMRGYMHGRGVRTLDDGAVHDGMWSFSTAFGQGVRTYADGSRYVGSWSVGMRHGHGTHTFANGDVYDGEWRWDKRHGYGTFTLHNGADHCCGMWIHDQLALDTVTASNGRTWAQVVQQRQHDSECAAQSVATGGIRTRRNRSVAKPGAGQRLCRR
nr:Morn repeat domain containing protein [Pandoravirus aubagnensis]